MSNKQKNILIWLTVWVGLLVGILYSPMGSPDLYSDVHYYNPNQGVDFSGVKIANTPKDNGGQAGSYATNPLPVSGQSAVRQRTSSRAADYSSGAAPTNYDNTTSRTVQTTEGGAVASPSLPVAAGSGAAGASTSHSTQNMVAMNTDVSSLENNFDRQSVGYVPGSGATDPGGDPTGDPIPVGDGWPLLLLFASVYIYWKTLKK